MIYFNRIIDGAQQPWLAANLGGQLRSISHGSRRPQNETVGTHQCEKPVGSSRQRGAKPRRKDAVGRKSEQHPNHPQPKPSSVQSAVGCVHRESDSSATNEHAKTDHQTFSKSLTARNQPSNLQYLSVFACWQYVSRLTC